MSHNNSRFPFYSVGERLQDSEKEDLAAAVNAASTDQGFESD